MAERLQKVMAEFGVASRRKAEEIIAAGRVKVNGIQVTEPGTKVDKEKDVIEVDGKLIKGPDSKVYILLNKPVGYITSAKDQFGRPTVLDLVKGVGVRVFPIGRLDYDTEGLILLTNDGELTYRITHPRHNIDKTYKALIKGEADARDIEAFAAGLAVEDYVASPAKLEIIRYSKGNSIVEITIHEGRNRQVRKMCSAIGHEVMRLKRIRIGKLGLGTLKTGEWRYLSDTEVEYLYKLGGEPDAANKKSKA
jgi:23S rRNA pseudouridine2605 synthase